MKFFCSCFPSFKRSTNNSSDIRSESTILRVNTDHSMTVTDSQGSVFSSTSSTPFYSLRRGSSNETGNVPATRLRNSSTAQPIGSMSVNQYEMESLLQGGATGRDARVYIARSTSNNELYAIKVFHSSLLKKQQFCELNSPLKRAFDRVQSEIAILQKLSHPNIVSLVEVIDDPTTDRLYMVMEYVSNGSVMPDNLKGLKALAPLDTWLFFRDLLLGVDYLHQQSIVHRDIKPANCLIAYDEERVNKKKLKIGDFGFSEIIGDESSPKGSLVQDCTSPAFCAPEIISNESHCGKFSDVWAMGVTLYVFAFGKLPFYHENIFNLFKQIAMVEPKFPDNVDPLLADLIGSMLEKDLRKRITVGEIFHHPWVTAEHNYPLPQLSYDAITLEDGDVDGVFKEMYNDFESDPCSEHISIYLDSSSERHSRRASLVHHPRRSSVDILRGESKCSSIFDVEIPQSLVEVDDSVEEEETWIRPSDSLKKFEPMKKFGSLGVSQFSTSNTNNDGEEYYSPSD
ncbi:hypothetical protein P9112_013304 [Eukaryota sp. TZLM1-RC]